MTKAHSTVNEKVRRRSNLMKRYVALGSLSSSAAERAVSKSETSKRSSSKDHVC
jgi:hypothetical protein